MASDGGGGLPAFFTNGSVDDQKYASLLEDLRAHDLLGPSEGAGSGASGAMGAMGGGAFGGTSLFFNDAFSAVFMGNFSDQTAATGTISATATATATEAAGATASAAAAKPPPGFARAPPGLAPTATDLKWARGQQEFSRMQQTPMGVSSSQRATETVSPSGEGEGEAEALDESQVPSLQALGLDDDDVGPVPSPPPPPPPPSAWQMPPTNAPQPSMPPMPPGMQTQGQGQGHAPPPPPPSGIGGMRGPPMPPQQQFQHQHQHQHPHHHQQHQQHPGMSMPMHMPPPMPMHMQGPPMPMPMPMPMHMHGRPPPPGHMGGPGFHGPPPPPHGPWGMHMVPPMPPPPPRFKMMTPRDIQFVVQQQMKQIRLSDPFSDDYYFHNYAQKRARAASAPVVAPVPSTGSSSEGARSPGVDASSSSSSSASPPSSSPPSSVGTATVAAPPRGLPLPSWKLEHIKSVNPQDVTRAAKSREWESENQVLGRNNQRSLYRPKQLLVLNQPGNEATMTVEALAGQDEQITAAGADSKEMSAATTTQHDVFASELWQRRQEIDRGLQCLLSLQDARHLLDARGINVQQFHSLEHSEMDPALRDLRALTTRLLLELAALLGVVVGASSPGHAQGQAPAQGQGQGQEVMACQLPQLRRMLAVAKGKRLVARALPLLHPSARFALLPHLLELMLSAAAIHELDGQAPDDEDERLCQTLVLMLLYHPPAPPASLLADALQRAMAHHSLVTLRTLLYNRGRAEVLQALLQRGGTAVAADGSEALQHQWSAAQERFVTLATAIKQSS